jgi:hypothetical protein
MSRDEQHEPHNHNRDQGEQVRAIEQHAKSVCTSKTGLFAALRGLPHTAGSGAPSRASRVLALAAGSIAALALLALPAAAQAESCPNEATRVGPSVTLPDCRAFEMVTPVDKSTTVQDLDGGQYDIAANGERIAMVSGPTFGPRPEIGDSFSVFSRTPSGWALESVKPPNSGAVSYTENGYIFNPDLTQIASLAGSRTPLSPGLTFEVGVPGGPYTAIAAQPRFKIEPDHEEEKASFSEEENGQFLAATSDFSHVVFSSIDHTLVSETPTGTYGGAIARENAFDLYEWVTGQLRLVNVSDDGSVIGPCGAALGGAFGHPHAMSTDGSKIFFTSPGDVSSPIGAKGCSNGPDTPAELPGAVPPLLYMRVSETVGGQEVSRTVELAHPAKGVSLSPEEEKLPVNYENASADGSKVFFTTNRALTPGADVGDLHLYMQDTDAPEGEGLTLIDQQNPLVADYGEFLGSDPVYTPSENEDVVYFYREYGGPKALMRYETGGGGLQAIATIQESQDGGEPTYVTPNGEIVVFGSGGVSGEPRGAGPTEIYRYDHYDGSLTCVSCGPGNGPPPRTVTEGGPGGDLATEYLISDDGSRVFFDDRANLVPQVVTEGEELADGGLTREVENVYEWEADGAGTCTQNPSCTFLISPGNTSEGSFLVGQSPDGNNVFFQTHARLVTQDVDSAGDIYDARVDGGFPAPAEPTTCLGDTCLSVPVAPIDPTPSSLTFTGPGNTVPAAPAAAKPKASSKAKQCAKGRVRRKGKCVKQPKAKKTARRAAGHDRGGSK